MTGLQALLLYNQLLHLTDQRSRAAGQYMESEPVERFETSLSVLTGRPDGTRFNR